MLNNALCLCTSSNSHQLDHLAVLSYVLDIPLLLTDPLLYKQGKHFYPFTNLLYLSDKDCSLEFLAKNYEVLFVSCKHWGRELAISMKELFNKSLRFFYCPHGNSDKGHLNPETDLLHHQDLSLVYGSHMKDMLAHRGVLQTLQGTATTGNYRYHYYMKHKPFYDSLIQKEVFSKFKKNQTTILYAPTWKDPENSTSFFEVSELLLKQLPDHYNLIVKLHPNLEHDHPAHVYSLIGKYENKPNVIFLSQYPLVYPILNQIDIYLGDFSSVGYDFLAFNKPMLFFNTPQRNLEIDKGLFLFRCGEIIPKEIYHDLYSLISMHLKNTQDYLLGLRQKIYEYAFEKNTNPITLQKEIIHLLKTTQPLY